MPDGVGRKTRRERRRACSTPVVFLLCCLDADEVSVRGHSVEDADMPMSMLVLYIPFDTALQGGS